MERSKYFIILTLILLTGFINTRASYKQEIYKAFITNNMALWKNVLDAMNKAGSKSNDYVLELLNYHYGYIAWCLGNDQKDLAERYLASGQAYIQLLEKTGYKPSMVYAYKSAFHGYSIGLNILKAPFLGPKSIECAKLAIKQDNTNPYGYIQYANAQYYMPAAFGGSKKEALEYYLKAKNLMEAAPSFLKDDWNYLSLLTTIAQAYVHLEDYRMAQAYYQKILKIEPGFLWVKNELYPQLLQKIKENL